MLVIKAINHDPDGASVKQRNAIYATIVPWESNGETIALAKQDTEQVDFEAAMREFKMFSSFVQELREEVCRHRIPDQFPCSSIDYLLRWHIDSKIAEHEAEQKHLSVVSASNREEQ